MIAKDLNFKHPCFCYVLYVNNLSAGTVAAIDRKLRAHKAYLGYVPCTYASLAKTFVSMHLMHLVIKRGSTVILGHEDERPNTENHNLHFHDFAALGLRLKSLQSMYLSTFLSYKPEWMLMEESDDDLEIALRAMSEAVAPLTEFTVVIEDDKFEKLRRSAQGARVCLAMRAGSGDRIWRTIPRKVHRDNRCSGKIASVLCATQVWHTEVPRSGTRTGGGGGMP